jgi:hypothetical protein
MTPLWPAGWPIATGVTEGACRHLVKDRMEVTGACWSLAGAEGILPLRGLSADGDLDAYWPRLFSCEARGLDPDAGRVHPACEDVTWLRSYP